MFSIIKKRIFLIIASVLFSTISFILFSVRYDNSSFSSNIKPNEIILSERESSIACLTPHSVEVNVRGKENCSKCISLECSDSSIIARIDSRNNVSFYGTKIGNFNIRVFSSVDKTIYADHNISIFNESGSYTFDAVPQKNIIDIGESTVIDWSIIPFCSSKPTFQIHSGDSIVIENNIVKGIKSGVSTILVSVPDLSMSKIMPIRVTDTLYTKIIDDDSDRVINYSNMDPNKIIHIPSLVSKINGSFLVYDMSNPETLIPGFFVPYKECDITFKVIEINTEQEYLISITYLLPKRLTPVPIIISIEEQSFHYVYVDTNLFPNRSYRLSCGYRQSTEPLASLQQMQLVFMVNNQTLDSSGTIDYTPQHCGKKEKAIFIDPLNGEIISEIEMYYSFPQNYVNYQNASVISLFCMVFIVPLSFSYSIYLIFKKSEHQVLCYVNCSICIIAVIAYSIIAALSFSKILHALLIAFISFLVFFGLIRFDKNGGFYNEISI